MDSVCRVSCVVLSLPFEQEQYFIITRRKQEKGVLGEGGEGDGYVMWSIG